MKYGLLWGLVENRPLEEQIKEAAAEYKSKFGFPVNTCLFNKDDVPKTGLPEIPKISLRVKRYVLKGTILVGNDNITKLHHVPLTKKK